MSHRSSNSESKPRTHPETTTSHPADLRVICTERPIDWPLDVLSKALEPGPTSRSTLIKKNLLNKGLVDADRLTWLNQVHGSHTVTVTSPGIAAGAAADAAVTTCVGAQLLIRTADCAPIVLWGTAADGTRVLGVAHAGWTGLMAGVCESVVRAMRVLGASRVRAQIGSCIGPECYEFGSTDLAAIATRFGPTVVAKTSWNTNALDLTIAVIQALRSVDVDAEKMFGWQCTACEPNRLYSHRARQDAGRLGLIAEITPNSSRFVAGVSS